MKATICTTCPALHKAAYSPTDKENPGYYIRWACQLMGIIAQGKIEEGVEVEDWKDPRWVSQVHPWQQCTYPASVGEMVVGELVVGEKVGEVVMVDDKPMLVEVGEKPKGWKDGHPMM